MCFCCAVFRFFTTMPRDWLGRTSLKWPVLCRVGRKTLTQSINQTEHTVYEYRNNEYGYYRHCYHVVNVFVLLSGSDDIVYCGLSRVICSHSRMLIRWCWLNFVSHRQRSLQVEWILHVDVLQFGRRRNHVPLSFSLSYCSVLASFNRRKVFSTLSVRSELVDQHG